MAEVSIQDGPHEHDTFVPCGGSAEECGEQWCAEGDRPHGTVRTGGEGMSEVLRQAEREIREYLGTVLAALWRVDTEDYASYPMVLGDIAARVEPADRLAALGEGKA